MKLKHFFIPHPKTHKKAHLLSIKALLVYVVLFLLLQAGLKAVTIVKPGVLGVSSNITVSTVIDLTNQQRVKDGLSPLKENTELDSAAVQKAKNMFAENYWAHFAPSGKSPWDFISASGYKYSYAGENLARNFYNSPDVVAAWMASPSHRENILNSHYQDIGIAVVDGVLQGQKTTLVVQEFGTPNDAIAAAPQVGNSGSTALNTPSEESNPQTLAASGQKQQVLVDPYKVTKYFGEGVVFLLIALLILDFYIIKRRGVVRISTRHLPQIAFLITLAVAIIAINPGGIL